MLGWVSRLFNRKAGNDGAWLRPNRYLRSRYDAAVTNSDNYRQLLDLCGRVDCLIADRDGIYDPSSINGRLLLGLKGQISELELHTIRARLTAGILSKAERGELALTLPTGLMRLESGQVVKHPDCEVQQRINLIFQSC